MKTKITFLIFGSILVSNLAFANPITEINSKNLPFLKYGLTNGYVKSLQEFLNEAGYSSVETGDGSSGHETRHFGDSTKKSIMILQKYYSIPVTGVIDTTTAKAINNAIKDDGITNDQISADSNQFLQGTTNSEQIPDIRDIYKDTSTPTPQKSETKTLQSPKRDTFFSDFLEKALGKPRTSDTPSPTINYQNFLQKIISSIFSN